MEPITNIADRLFRKADPIPDARDGETLAPAFCAIDCPGRCPLKLHLREGELAGVSAVAEAPACHRGLSMRAWANSPDRLMWPLRRVGPRGSARFERIGWDEALDEVARQLARIRSQHGEQAIYLAYTTGQSCTTADPFERLMNRFGGFLDHYNNYSNPQINAMVRSMFGPGTLYPGGSDLDAAASARLVLVFGASPAETGTGRATWHGAWDRVVEQVGAHGGRIVVVDPRRNGSIPKRKGRAADDAGVVAADVTDEGDGVVAPSVAADIAGSAGTAGSSTGMAADVARTTDYAGSPAGTPDAAGRGTACGQTVSWLPINPGTDGALVAALLHELAFTHNALDWDFLRERCIGFTDGTMPGPWRGQGLSVMDYLIGTGYDRIRKTPAWAARITGIGEGKIRALASQLAQARPAFIMQGWGPQRRSNGEMTSGMIMMLAATLGQVGLPGTNNGMNAAWGGGFLTRVPADRNHVPFQIPAYRFLDAVEDGTALGPKEGVRGLQADGATRHDSGNGCGCATPNVQHKETTPHLPCSIKAIICHGGNCLTNQHGNVNRAHRVLGDPTKCEFILNVDVEFTDSARYADIVLPDLFRMEQLGVMDAETWGRRIVAGSGALGARFERRSAWDICCELAKRWGIENTFTEGLTEEGWMRTLYERDRERCAGLPPFDRLIEEGLAWRSDCTEPFVAMADWRRDPVAHPLDTPSGKIELFSEQLAATAATLRGTPDEGAVTPVPTFVPEWDPVEFGVGSGSDCRNAGKADNTNRSAYASTAADIEGAPASACDRPLRVFGYHSIARIHSSWGNVPAVSRRVPQVISINPADAAARGIASGELVEASNRFGTLRLPAHVTEDVIAGTVIMPQGAWWRAADNENAQVESADGAAPIDIGGCINTLTSSRPSPLAFGNPQHTSWCRLRKPASGTTPGNEDVSSL